MKQFASAAAALLYATTAYASVEERDLCADGSTDDNGNWYCQAVQAITYTGVGGDGKYNRVTSMDSNSGTCGSTPFGYSGTMSPLDEEVSMSRGRMAWVAKRGHAPEETISVRC